MRRGRKRRRISRWFLIVLAPFCVGFINNWLRVLAVFPDIHIAEPLFVLEAVGVLSAFSVLGGKPAAVGALPGPSDNPG